MMSSHSSFHTLSRNIRPYMHKVDETLVSKLETASTSKKSGLSDIKIQLLSKTKSIEKLVGFLQDVTWLDIPDEETRSAIVDLIQIAKLYYNEEKAFSASLQSEQKTKDFHVFSLALEDLQETIQDVESAIITLPKLDGYNEIFDELSRL